MEGMNDFKEASGSSEDIGSEGSDPSLSDSWTVLDSSHLCEDDLSDAESVEVLATDGNSTCDKNISTFICQDDDFPSEDSDGESPFVLGDGDEGNDNCPFVNGRESTVNTVVTSSLEVESKKCFLQNFFNLSILLIILDVFLILAFVSTNKAPFIFGWQNYSRNSDSIVSKTLTQDESFHADPLLLQLSHVLSKWEKNPDEEYIAAHQILKTLLAFFSGDIELESEVRDLSKKVKQLDRVVARTFKNWVAEDESMKRILTLGRLAHSTLNIFHQKNKIDSFTDDSDHGLNMSCNGRKKCCLQSRLWWQFSTVQKMNDTFHAGVPNRSPVTDLQFHLGSAQWNSYFWGIYLKDLSVPSKAQDLKALEALDSSAFTWTNISEPSSNDKGSIPWDSQSKPRNPYRSLNLSMSNTEEIMDVSQNSDCQGNGCEKKESHEKPLKEKLQPKQRNHKTGKKKKTEESKKRKKLANSKENKFKLKSSKTDKKHSPKKNVTIELNVKELNVDMGQMSTEEKEDLLKYDINEDMEVPRQEQNGNTPNISRKLKKRRKRQVKSNEKMNDWNFRMAHGREKLRALGEDNDWNTRMARGREKLRALNIGVGESIWTFVRAKGRGKLREEFLPL